MREGGLGPKIVAVIIFALVAMAFIDWFLSR